MREYLHDRRLQWFGHLEKNVIRVLALVNWKPSKLVVVFPEDNLEKHGMRL